MPYFLPPPFPVYRPCGAPLGAQPFVPEDAALDAEALTAVEACLTVDDARVECRLQKVRLLLAAHEAVGGTTAAATNGAGNGVVNGSGNGVASNGAALTAATPKRSAGEGRSANPTRFGEAAWAEAEAAVALPVPVRSFGLVR